MQPSVAHEPNATRILDLRRSRWAISSFSLLRMPPLNRHSKIEPSSIALTSLYLASIATGQKTTSKLASTSRIFSPIFSTAISQPPHDAAQYMANLGLSLMQSPPPLPPLPPQQLVRWTYPSAVAPTCGLLPP